MVLSVGVTWLDMLSRLSIFHCTLWAWRLVLKYEILGGGEVSHEAAERPYKPPLAKELLQNWLQATMPEDQPVNDLTNDLNTGKLLCPCWEGKNLKPGTVPNFHSLHPEDVH